MQVSLTRFLGIAVLGCALTLSSCVNPYLGPNGPFARGAFIGGQSHTVRSLGLRGRGHPLGYRAQSGRPRYTATSYRRSYSPVMLSSSRYGSRYGYSPSLGFGSPFRHGSSLGFGSPFGMGFGSGFGGYGW